MIGIGVTTRDRREIAEVSIKNISALAPPNSRMVVIDDGSRVPFPSSPSYTVIRNEKALGVAASKNMCLAQLDDCAYVFLFDDDVYPMRPDWWRQYVCASEATGIGHMMLIYSEQRHPKQRDAGNKILQRFQRGPYTFCQWKGASGLMLFFNRKCLDAVGGMDADYGLWGCEHLGMSMRCFNMGFTPFPWIDLSESRRWFYSYDYLQGIPTTLPDDVRLPADHIGRRVFEEEQTQWEWKPYQRDVLVLGAMLSAEQDHQHPTEPFIVNQGRVQAWADSLARQQMTGVLFTDQPRALTPGRYLKIVGVPPIAGSPYQTRWTLFAHWIRKNRRYLSQVWITDVTDVTLLNRPCIPEQPALFCGEDDNPFDCEWMRVMAKDYPPYARWLRERPKQIMRNAGVLGGDPDRVARFCTEMVVEIDAHKKELPDTDMPQFNRVADGYRMIHGHPVTTPFKAYRPVPDAWWMHK